MAPDTLQQQAPARTALLRDRNFLLLWLAQVISSVGDLALAVALPVTVYNATGSKTVLGLTMLSGTVPVVLFGLLGGVYADRWDRRRTMIVTDIGRALAVMLLLGVSRTPHLGSRDLGLVYGVSFLVASLSCFFSPARIGLLPFLLPREKMLAANGLMLSGMQATLMLGPALGGALLAWVHPHGVFVFDALTFLASAALVGLMAVGATAAPGSTAARGVRGLWQDAREGLDYVWTRPLLRGTLTLLVLAVLGSYVVNTLEFAFVRDLWHGTGRQFGLLLGLSGAAALLTGAAAAAPLRGVSPPRLMAVGFTVMAGAGLAVAAAGDVFVGGAMLCVQAVGNTLVNLGLVTVFQTNAPVQLQGRVNATVGLVQKLSIAGGAALATELVLILPGTRVLRPIFDSVALSYVLCALLARPLLGPDAPEAEGREAEAREGQEA